jgi:hypothetical protein
MKSTQTTEDFKQHAKQQQWGGTRLCECCPGPQTGGCSILGAIIEGIKLSVAVPCAGESPNLHDTIAGSLDVRKTHSKQNLAAPALLINKNETIYINN